MGTENTRGRRFTGLLIGLVGMIILASGFIYTNTGTVEAAKANSDGVTYRISGSKITLYWGTKPTAGYSIKIVSMKRTGDKLTVYYSLKSPAAGSFQAQVITYPKATAVIPSGKSAIKTVVLVNRDKQAIKTTVSSSSALPVVGSYDNLKKLLAEAEKRGESYGRYRIFDVILPTVRAMKKESAEVQSTGNASGDYSRTNVQVEGVDEADTVKTDGRYIYQIGENKVLVIKAVPPDKMEVTDTIDYSEGGLNPVELYISGNRLVVIGTSSNYIPCYPAPLKGTGRQSTMCPPWPRNQTTKAVIYDASNRYDLKKLRVVELEGSYVSSRMIGDNLYLLARKYIYGYREEPEPDLRPFYRDSAVKDDMVPMDYKAICYFPGLVETSYLTIAGVDVDGMEKAQVKAYLGSGENVYCSSKNLYVAVSSYKNEDYYSKIYRFKLDGRQVTASGSGEVKGTPLNQFSMDENGDYFRIATTSGDIWRNDEKTSKNNVYVLDKNMKVTGKLEDVAPGEKIYSTRFMGDRLYMVTFRTVDPFFVIDLKNPAKPKILGALKIPGYSDYLHPYDENHIIGFGKNTVEGKGWNGDTMAYYMGMKIAVFDVTDVSKPVEMFKTTIGDRGTDSELLRNHKALLFSKEKGLLAFPVTVMEVKEKMQDIENMPQYGTFTFQGAYVYSLNLKDGFKLRGRITHLSKEDYEKAGNYWYDGSKNVQRILYIGSNLYTLSNSKVMANDMQDLSLKGELSLKED